MKMTPDAFERLAQRLLREAGFRNVEVLGKSGDGGIDGVGVYRLSLVSFPVYFQCKRWANQVPAAAVRDFRGAMSGRGEKGLLITTATFSPAAREEATRDGAPPVDLVSGEDLCDLLKDHELGVATTTRTIEDIQVIEDFFDEL
jgi:restriction system protein